MPYQGGIWQTLLAAVIFQVICLKVADWTAPMMSEFFDLPGVSIATGSFGFLMHQVFT